jgi:adenine-specific DNA-methyltransferase
LLSVVEETRLHLSKTTEANKKSQLGQFLTPARIATFMASLFPASRDSCRLLDAGAGIGSLSLAFLERWRSGELPFDQVTLDAFEIDPDLLPHLSRSLRKYESEGSFHSRIRHADFILASTDAVAGDLFAEQLPRYTHAILNPPYKKLNSHSAHRLALRRAGIETVNLYSAFVALAVAELAPGGQLVAIIPRSFCNGPYYRPFREFILERTAIAHMHLFNSRSKAFKDDAVLQENLIIRLERGATQGTVTVSTSTDDSFSDLATHDYAFERIVLPSDTERFIHVPTSPERSVIDLSPTICHTLADLGLKVSTGPVVDFRLKEHLRDMPEPGTVPLLYPIHCTNNNTTNNGTTWPLADIKKPNAIAYNADTKKWLYPNGFYCVVRRFSAKEEKRRIVASVITPSTFADAPMLGFENHLNLFHEDKHGLPEALARGLTVFLNTTAVDEHFRCFNGHTQVNATDLKLMKYPSHAALIELGEWAMQQSALSQAMIDAKLGTMTA